MDLFLCWLLGPLILILAAVGLSFGLELITGVRFSWLVRPGLGLAVMIVVAQFAVSTDATAELAIPLIVALGILGLIMGWSAGLIAGPVPRWEIAGALGVYFVFAAPVIFSGEPTWAGYVKLDDTATWMGLTDHAFEFGRRTTGFPASTWEALIAVNAGNGYPIGSFVPMALIGKVVGQDVAWTVQPSMALMAGMLALLIAEMLRPLIKTAQARAALAFLGTQSAILFGYTLWGGIKEVAVAALLGLGPPVASEAIRQPQSRWAWAPVGVIGAAFLAVVGPGGVAWLLPLGLVVLLEGWRRLGWEGTLFLGFKSALVVAALTLPQLIAAGGLFSPLQGPLVEGGELGNLAAPLSLVHVMGVWPAEDFRLDPHFYTGIKLLALALLGLGGFAAWTALKDRALPLLAYVLGGVGAGAVVYVVGSPWIEAKAMAIVSPALLTAGLAGATLLVQRTRFNIEGWLLGSLTAATIIWSSFLLYHGVWLAPHDEERELEQIGETYAGRGPALFTEGSTYGPRHFLRKLDAENAKDLRRRQVTLRDGTLPDELPYLDIDAIPESSLAPYRLLVIRRAPVASRPPGDFRLVYQGTYYQVWERAGSGVFGASLVAHLPLGEGLESGAVPDCSAVKDLAGQAGSQGTLLAALPDQTSVLDLTTASMPADWATGESDKFLPVSSGTLEMDTQIGAAGDYLLWIGGDILGKAEVSVGGQPPVSRRMAINNNLYQPFGPFALGPGTQRVTVKYEVGGLAPGSGADPLPVGPLILEQVSAGDRGTINLPAPDYRQLCGAPWDWIEAYS